MREGSAKLLAACSRVDQALEASKSLLTSNTRLLALLSHLQQMRMDRVLGEMRRNSVGLEIPAKAQKQQVQNRWCVSCQVVCLQSATRGQISSFFSPTPTSFKEAFILQAP